MARSPDGSIAYRHNSRGVFVAQPGEPWLGAQPWADEGKWRWGTLSLEEKVTIIALGVPADATAADLQRLADVFEIDRLLTSHRLPARVKLNGETLIIDRWLYDLAVQAGGDDGWTRIIAEHLHRVGWEPGMTAEDARRLLK